MGEDGLVWANDRSQLHSLRYSVNNRRQLSHLLLHRHSGSIQRVHPRQCIHDIPDLSPEHPLQVHRHLSQRHPRGTPSRVVHVHFRNESHPLHQEPRQCLGQLHRVLREGLFRQPVRPDDLDWSNNKPEQYSACGYPDRFQLPSLHDRRNRVHLHPGLILYDSHSHVEKQPVQLYRHTLDNLSSRPFP